MDGWMDGWKNRGLADADNIYVMTGYASIIEYFIQFITKTMHIFS